MHVVAQEVCLHFNFISSLFTHKIFRKNCCDFTNFFFFQDGQEAGVKMPSVFAKTNLVKIMLNVSICLRIIFAYAPKELMVKIARLLQIAA